MTSGNAFFSCLLHLLSAYLNLFALYRYCFTFEREDNVSLTTLSRYLCQAVPVSEASFHSPHVVFLLHILSFIVEFLALPYTDLYLDLSRLEIEFQGNKRQPFFLRLAVQTLNFPFVQQQFSHPQIIMIGSVAVSIGSNMHIIKKNFAVLHKGITVLKVGLSVAKRLHFRSHKGNSRFVGIVNEIIQPGCFILADDFLRNIVLCQGYTLFISLSQIFPEKKSSYYFLPNLCPFCLPCIKSYMTFL